MPETPSFILQQEALDEVARELHGLLTDGDEFVYFAGSFLGPTAHGNFWAIRQDGSSSSCPKGPARSLRGPRGSTFVRALDRLRDACYVQGKGTWFGIAVTVMPDGSTTAEYNYDTEFEWDSPIEPTLWVQEQEKYPRDLEHQPEWFKRRLAEGQAALEEYRRDPQGYYDRM